ncbi:MAG TPA: acyl-CoA thioesterase/bile acid-CoA:amino acid N-acyltransferase family protein [Trebonia sp.]
MALAFTRKLGSISAGVAVALLTGGLTACSGGAPAKPAVIQVSEPSALADQAIDIRVAGLSAGEQVTVSAQATDAKKGTWRSSAVYTASQGGTVDLAEAAPKSGSYQGKDGMGLFWSLRPVAPASQDQYFTPPPPQQQPGYPVTLTVTSSSGAKLGSRTVTREWMAKGETVRTLTLAKDKVAGELFLPRPGTARHAGVLVFGGAEGGMSQVYGAALLAAHGYPAVTVAYFDWPGLPPALDGIPLEYFETAGKILASQPQVDPAHILAMGYSRGSEAALLLADNFPTLFHGAVVYSPSSEVNTAGDNQARAAWILGPRVVDPGPIDVSHISGPVLAVAGKDDSIWGSASSANAIILQRSVDHSRYKDQALIYQDAGHGVGMQPYQPAGDTTLLNLGGTRAGNVAAQRDGWPKMLALLAGLTAQG